MSYYVDEILNELEVGEVYTSRQIDIFYRENSFILILSDTNEFVNSQEIKYEVISKKLKYVHKRDNRSYDRTYSVPNKESRVYEVKRIS